MENLKRGDIVWSVVPDPEGGNEKRRPVVILTASDDIAENETLHVAAVTTTLIEDPLPDTHILLPYDRRGRHPMTGLNKRGAVVTNWICEIEKTAIDEKAGRVPGKTLYKILEQISEL